MAKKFVLHRCEYCGSEWRTADELVNHWLEYKGKCTAPNVVETDTKTS